MYDSAFSLKRRWRSKIKGYTHILLLKSHETESGQDSTKGKHMIGRLTYEQLILFSILAENAKQTFHDYMTPPFSFETGARSFS